MMFHYKNRCGRWGSVNGVRLCDGSYDDSRGGSCDGSSHHSRGTLRSLGVRAELRFPHRFQSVLAARTGGGACNLALARRA